MLEDQKRREDEKRRSLLCRMAGNVAAGFAASDGDHVLPYNDYERKRVAEAAVSIARHILEAVDGEAAR